MSQTFTFAPYLRPTKIEWLLPEATADNWIEKIASDSTRKIARNLDDIIQKANLMFSITEMTQSIFDDWLQYYAKKMTEQGHDVIAKKEWLSEKNKAGLKVYLIDVMQNGQRVGSSVFSVTAAQKFTEHFKASDRITVSSLKNASLGTVIDLFYIRNALHMGAHIVSSGSSRNGFGFYNNLGYLAFKIKLGYKPVIAEIGEFSESFEYNEGEPCIWFMTQNKQHLEVLIQNKGQINQEVMSLIEKLNLPITDK